jgi:hypothetical protein
MGRYESFRQYAADCVRRAETEQNPEDKTLLLNLALAWIRLAQQSQAAGADRGDITVIALPKPVPANRPTAPAA